MMHRLCSVAVQRDALSPLGKPSEGQPSESGSSLQTPRQLWEHAEYEPGLHWLGVSMINFGAVLYGSVRSVGPRAAPSEILHFRDLGMWSFSGCHFQIPAAFPFPPLLFFKCSGVRNQITKPGRNEYNVTSVRFKANLYEGICNSCIYFLVCIWIMGRRYW